MPERSHHEQVVLLDDAGERIGVHDKATVHHAHTPLHLAFSCYLFNADGELLLTRRADDKVTFPGVLTNSVCGHPAPGETLEDAVRRRAQLELCLVIDRLWLVLPDFAYRAEMNGIVENERCPVLAGITTDQPDPNPDEVGHIEWMAWSRYRDQVLDGRLQVSPWSREQVRQLAQLGDDPHHWPAGDRGLLPLALQQFP